jgi:hypothetical protein
MSDDKPVISDEAVEAAMFAFANAPYLVTNQEQMQLALEAAAPYLLAQGWDEGVAYVFEGGAEVHDENPYRSQA